MVECDLKTRTEIGNNRPDPSKWGHKNQNACGGDEEEWQGMNQSRKEFVQS